MTIKKIRGKNLSQFWSKQEEIKIRTRIWESFNYSGFVKYLNKEDQAI